MTTHREEPTVLDSTVLSNFAYIDRVDLLEALPRVCSVPEVRTEVRTGVEGHPHLQRAADRLGDSIPVVKLESQERGLRDDHERRLDPGEAAALAVAEHRNGTVVTDDGRARSIARTNDVPVTGSIGVLIRATESGHVERQTADRWLKTWIDETDYRAPSRDLSDYE